MTKKRANPNRSALPTSNRIFIVYESHERKLVELLDTLLRVWGYDGFYCRDETRNRPGEDYRTVLRTKLFKADLVLLMLSRSFGTSSYCQAEAGATATMSKKHIPIIIPPVISDDVRLLVPVLNTENIFKAVDPDKLDSFCSRLKRQIGLELSVPALESPGEISLMSQLDEELTKCIRHYSITAPVKQMNVWPSIEDKQAARSLVEHLKISLGKKSDSSFSLVGVSLKFSLLLLNEALEEYGRENALSENAGKQVSIQLVYMDAHAHILQALEDEIDKKEIRLRMSTKWPAMQQRWDEISARCGFHLKIDRHVIDYIPPRVGVLIDDKMLYAGRCSVRNVSKSESFNLLVGEKPYFQYVASAFGDDSRISEFKEMLKLYQCRRFNGALLCDESGWLSHFEECIRHSPSLKKLIIVSSSAFNCRRLIPLALKTTKATVDVFVQNPKSIVHRHRKQAIMSLTTDFLEELERLQLDVSRVNVYYYEAPPTFRAVLLEGQMVGVSCYSFAPQLRNPTNCPEWELAKANPVNIVVTQHGPQFEVISGSFIYDFIATAQATPVFNGARPKKKPSKQ